MPRKSWKSQRFDRPKIPKFHHPPSIVQKYLVFFKIMFDLKRFIYVFWTWGFKRFFKMPPSCSSMFIWNAWRYRLCWTHRKKNKVKKCSSMCRGLVLSKIVILLEFPKAEICKIIFCTIDLGSSLDFLKYSWWYIRGPGSIFGETVEVPKISEYVPKP